MKKIAISIFVIVLFQSIFSNILYAQEGNRWLRLSYLKGLEYRIKAGVNLGGTSPLPLPAEIREINSYDPTLSISLEGNMIKRFGDWGALLGLRFEKKGMKTDARVKNYGMAIDMANRDGSSSHVEGMWTGSVKTKVSNDYLTIPLMALYRISKRWEVKAGPYVSYLIDGEFSGSVYDGYLREGSPVGSKTEFTGDTTASYDFSEDMRKWQYGVEVGTEWKAFSHLNVALDLCWGLNSIFKKDFKTITFAMYPIYANVSFGYVF